eukprot:CAMPEP_0198727530 /NCGR_PEP_ID=MMETSP1475-20131203/4396_1 /TAXON_ID= ORGANISM="Unidentified sp., Strain CCMP1999" /NCGR_SAMPLE_ID=MMETSP1475 /ASSEMBLY_ACC=CAM_ASM_001111 /LENGTH=59 /DNA_ID=CAMNT_0044489581 /DNA_START=72 /DNA_END=251 /DNA_ORIENTATION=+
MGLISTRFFAKRISLKEPDLRMQLLTSLPSEESDEELSVRRTLLSVIMSISVSDFGDAM